MLSTVSTNTQAVQLLQSSQSVQTDAEDQILDPFDKTLEKIKGTNADILGVEASDAKVDLAAARIQARKDVDKEAKMNGVILDEDEIDYFATLKVINANRQEFGDEAFTVSFEAENGFVYEDTIKSIAFFKAEIFAEEIEEKFNAYLESKLEEDASLDPEYVKINVMTDIVETMVLDDADDTAGDEDAASDKISSNNSSEGQTAETGEKEFSKVFESYFEN